VKRNKQETELTDNYRQFLEQLDTASRNLRARQDSLGRTLQGAGMLFKQNELGLKLWEERRTRLEKLVSKQNLPPKKADSLRELYEVALRMESMFQLRVERIREK
jgi:multidrug resistance efflux pump